MEKNIRWSIGCSGFHYKEWKEIFYPQSLPQRLWFDHYCKYFSTLELNNTFYHFPRVTTLKNWYHKSPERFVFSVKAPRLITHYKKFNGTEQLLADFYGTVKEGLADKLGAILFQLPPQVHYSQAMLDQIVKSMHADYKNVVEFRHPSWWTDEVYQQLAARKICFCSISYPGGKIPDDVVVNTSFAYYRFHGVPVLYKSQYENGFIQELVDEISENKALEEVFIYFNNTWGTAALNNALWLKEYLAAKSIIQHLSTKKKLLGKIVNK